MFYSLVHYPKIDIGKIQEFRQKYDPYLDVIDPHITLIFHVPDSEDYESIKNHIQAILANFQPFDIHLKGLKKSWDHWLFLLLEEGNDKVIKLHDELYSGILAKYLRSDIEFEPHVAIGLFTQKDASYKVTDPKEVEFDEPLYNQALAEAKSLELDYWCKMDEVSLITLDDQLTKITVQEAIPL